MGTLGRHAGKYPIPEFLPPSDVAGNGAGDSWDHALFPLLQRNSQLEVAWSVFTYFLYSLAIPHGLQDSFPDQG